MRAADVWWTSERIAKKTKKKIEKTRYTSRQERRGHQASMALSDLSGDFDISPVFFLGFDNFLNIHLFFFSI